MLNEQVLGVWRGVNEALEARARQAEARLAQIRALPVHRISPDSLGWVSAETLQPILDAVSVDATPAQGEYQRGYFDGVLEAQNRIAEGMDATPAQGIDRDALLGILWTVKRGGDPHWALREVLALVRPVEGVVLSREEAAMAASWFRRVEADDEVPADAPDHALAARLEAAAGPTNAEASR